MLVITVIILFMLILTLTILFKVDQLMTSQAKINMTLLWLKEAYRNGIQHADKTVKMKSIKDKRKDAYHNLLGKTRYNIGKENLPLGASEASPIHISSVSSIYTPSSTGTVVPVDADIVDTATEDSMNDDSHSHDHEESNTILDPIIIDD